MAAVVITSISDVDITFKRNSRKFGYHFCLCVFRHNFPAFVEMAWEMLPELETLTIIAYCVLYPVGA